MLKPCMRTPDRFLRVLAVLSAALSVQAVYGDASIVQTDKRPAASRHERIEAPRVARLVRDTDLVYQGAFRVPAGAFPTTGLTEWQLARASFDYGGTALTFNPAKNSLFLVGHDQAQLVAEISIPTLLPGSKVTDLATASVLQPFTDATEGKMGAVGPSSVKVGGLLPYHGRLYLTAYVYYDAAGDQRLSHFVSGLDLKVQGDARGPFQVGKLRTGFVSGYLGLVPPAWQEALGGPVLNGQCCVNIISRTSYGPAVFTIDPENIGVSNPVPATPLVYYPAAHPLLEPGSTGDGWSNTSALFNGTSEVRGVVFPQGTRSVLFFGRQGLGALCYGPGTADASRAGTPATDIGDTVDRWCYDPADRNKGSHAYPYAYYVWAYDALDLAAVKSGRSEPWAVKPYAVWKLKIPFGNETAHLNGAAYDPQAGRIFVSTGYSDGERPLLHVFTLQSSPR